MKERPILFSGPMVRALLRGEKTQTRRAVKPQPAYGCRYEMNGAGTHALHLSDVPGREFVPPTPRSVDHLLPCPYGEPGDRLWVRETWAPCDDLVLNHDLDDPENVAYRADLSARFFDGLQPLDTTNWNWDFVGTGTKRGWRPSIFMPRWASRITLEVTEVRVQRVQDISPEDAEAEGCVCIGGHDVPLFTDTIGGEHLDPRGAYQALWTKINGAASWDANPWVWAITFKVLP